jgi:uncharacterized protein (DUF427 family)
VPINKRGRYLEKEFVWDYPRPPRLEVCSKEIEIIFGKCIAKTDYSYRVLETSTLLLSIYPEKPSRKRY